CEVNLVSLEWMELSAGKRPAPQQGSRFSARRQVLPTLIRRGPQHSRCSCVGVRGPCGAERCATGAYIPEAGPRSLAVWSVAPNWVERACHADRNCLACSDELYLIKGEPKHVASPGPPARAVFARWGESPLQQEHLGSDGLHDPSPRGPCGAERRVTGAYLP